MSGSGALPLMVGKSGTLRGLHYLQRYFGPQHDVIRAAYLLAGDARLQHMFGMEREERLSLIRI